MKNHTLTTEQIQALLKGDPDTVAQVKALIDPPSVKPWKELETVKGYYVASDSEIECTATGDIDPVNRNTFRTAEQAIGFGIAAAKLTQVVHNARNGWQPKWDGSQENWCVCESPGRLVVIDLSVSPTPFALPTLELAEQLLATCREELEQFYNAIKS